MDFVRHNLFLAPAFLFVTLLTAAQDSRQDGNLLQITSPASGTIFNPGQTIQVTVTSPTNVAFEAVAVVGEPVGFSLATSLPATFSLSIPRNTSCRLYTLTAFGTMSSGPEIDSPDVLIDVEGRGSPTSLHPYMPTISFDNLGETLPETISATFSHGDDCDVTESSKVVYSSSNPSIATVNATGMVTAVGIGEASIIVTYGGKLHIAIPVSVPPQALDPSVSSLKFDSQTVGISSNPKKIYLTNKTYDPMKVQVVGTTGDFSERDDCGSLSPLAAGGTCTISVTFTPTQLGLCEGSVSISQDFSGGLTIFLSGMATAVPKTPQ